MTTKVPSGNLTSPLPDPTNEEFLEELVSRRGVRIERIVSHGHASPKDVWYDQNCDEWVAVIDGEAELRIESEAANRRLRPGDWILLPAHCRHRVVSTAPDRPTVWLAIHLDD